MSIAPAPAPAPAPTSPGTCAAGGSPAPSLAQLLAPLLAAALIALPAVGPREAQAQAADRQQPVSVEADRMEYDDRRQTNVFSGNVVLTRGSLIIRGDRIVVRQDSEGFYHGTAFGAPASFSHKRAQPDDVVEGFGERLEYEGRGETLNFVGKASLRRLEGGRVVDEVHGARIVYDSRSEFFTVEGGSGATTPANPSGRVRAVLQPRSEEPAAGKTESRRP